jgi:hypothetical protein
MIQENNMTEESPAPVTITVTDLQNMLVLIDLATQRGALRAAELASVAALYEKINAFLKSSNNTPSAKE